MGHSFEDYHPFRHLPYMATVLSSPTRPPSMFTGILPFLLFSTFQVVSESGSSFNSAIKFQSLDVFMGLLILAAPIAGWFIYILAPGPRTKKSWANAAQSLQHCCYLQCPLGVKVQYRIICDKQASHCWGKHLRCRSRQYCMYIEIRPKKKYS